MQVASGYQPRDLEVCCTEGRGASTYFPPPRVVHTLIKTIQGIRACHLLSGAFSSAYMHTVKIQQLEYADILC